MDMKKNGAKKDSGTPAMDEFSNFKRLMDELEQKRKLKEPQKLTPSKDSTSSSEESKSRTPSPFSITPVLNPFK
ncbi:MAG: hypothetical protein Q8R83_08095 [Legionellaceae bacterium]|nr:hypothetical protein [Legionellaceae bacterium]